MPHTATSLDTEGSTGKTGIDSIQMHTVRMLLAVELATIGRPATIKETGLVRGCLFGGSARFKTHVTKQALHACVSKATLFWASGAGRDARVRGDAYRCTARRTS